MKKGGASQHWRRTQKKRSLTYLFTNKLPIPLHFNKPDLKSAKFDVESQISPIELICLKKPRFLKGEDRFNLIKNGFKLQDKLSKWSDYICKIYQAAYTARDFYIWQEKGVSLKAYLIEHPDELNSRLQQANDIVKRLWNEHRIQHTDTSTDNFIIINNQLKLIDFEQYSTRKSNDIVSHEAHDFNQASPKHNKTLRRLRTSSPKDEKTLRTSSPKRIKTLRTSSPT